MRTNCPACGTNDTNGVCLAIISPWVRELTGVEERSTLYSLCDGCCTGYVALTYSENELSLLYGSYRGSRYQKVRQSWEPSYTMGLNESLDYGQGSLQHRREQLTKIVESAVVGFSSNAEVVMDIGGGHGGVIPEWPNLKTKIVMDVSSTSPAEGIERITSWGELKQKNVNFIMVCGILEHLNNPLEFLIELVRNVRENNSTFVSSIPTLLYFEVPAGIPKIRSRKFQLFALALAKFRHTWRFVSEPRARKWTKQSPLRIAEHLQFFSKDGLVTLIERANLHVLHFEEYEATHGITDSKGLKFENALTLVARL
jgi:hypothetical protein